MAYVLGRKRAVRVAGGKAGIKDLHSLPTHYGALTALWCGIPAVLVFGCWLAFQDTAITSLVESELPEQIRSIPQDRLNLVVNDIKNLVSGNIISGDVDMAMPGDGVKLGIRLGRPIALDDGARFAIREGGRTVGSGVVTKVVA